MNTPSSSANILIIDDHDLFLEGLQLLLEQNDSLKVYSANCTKQAIKLIFKYKIDLILLDLDLSETDGLQFANQLLSSNHTIPFCILSATTHQHQISKAFSMGACGFIPKSASGQQMLDAIQRMLEGELIHASDDYFKTNKEYTKRQQQIIQLLAKGQSNKEIARSLNVSSETIKSHLKSIFQKMQTSNRSECIAYAIKNKII